MERIEPSNGVKMPAMNFGVYRITDPAECEAAVLCAIKAGWLQIALEATDMGRPLYERYGFVKLEDEMELIK